MVMTKHPKTDKPSEADLKGNPLVGGSKGATMAGVSADEPAQSEGANTIEGDVENDPNRQGGVAKANSRNRRRSPHILMHASSGGDLCKAGKRTNNRSGS